MSPNEPGPPRASWRALALVGFAAGVITVLVIVFIVR